MLSRFFCVSGCRLRRAEDGDGRFRSTSRKDAAMLGFTAAVLFIIAFLLNATPTATSVNPGFRSRLLQA